ncbi:MAG: glutamine synthetase beta-grasp domain-containing protein, partial [Acidithiobacillus sp.]
MGYSPSDVVKLIKEKDIKFVDFRFTDTKGKEQHVSVPGHVIEEDTFTEGKAFDGS